MGVSLLPDGFEAGECIFGIALGFMQNGLPEDIEGVEVGTVANEGATSGNPLF
jgi:hypothetical protein